MDGHGDTAFGCSVQLREDDAGDIGYLFELFGLCQCILAGGAVQDYQGLAVSFRIFFFNDPVELSKLRHKVFLVVSACLALAAWMAS